MSISKESNRNVVNVQLDGEDIIDYRLNQEYDVVMLQLEDKVVDVHLVSDVIHVKVGR